MHRPFAVFLLGVVTATSATRLEAGLTGMPRGNHESNSFHPAPRDGNDLEYTIDHIAPLAFSNRLSDRVQGTAYEARMIEAARYPASCASQIQSLLIFDATAQPVRDEKGDVLAVFDQHTDRLKMVDKARFEAKNRCQPGQNKRSPGSTLTAEKLIDEIEAAIARPNSLSSPEADRVQSAIYTWVSPNAVNMPGCNRDLMTAVTEVGSLHRNKAGRSDAELATERRKVVLKLAETALAPSPYGDCGIRYSAGMTGP